MPGNSPSPPYRQSDNSTPIMSALCVCTEGAVCRWDSISAEAGIVEEEPDPDPMWSFSAMEGEPREMLEADGAVNSKGR